MATTCGEIDIAIKVSSESTPLQGIFKTVMCNYQRNNNAVQDGEYGLSIIFEEPTATKIDTNLPICNAQHTFYDDLTGKNTSYPQLSS